MRRKLYLCLIVICVFVATAACARPKNKVKDNFGNFDFKFGNDKINLSDFYKVESKNGSKEILFDKPKVRRIFSDDWKIGSDSSTMYVSNEEYGEVAVYIRENRIIFYYSFAGEKTVCCLSEDITSKNDKQKMEQICKKYVASGKLTKIEEENSDSLNYYIETPQNDNVSKIKLIIDFDEYEVFKSFRIIHYLAENITDNSAASSVHKNENTTKAIEETTKGFEPVEVTLVAVGDILLHDNVSNSGKMDDGTYNYDHLFKNVKADISAADIALVNQEVILGGVDLGLSGYPTFNGAYEVGDALVKAGFDIIEHATNHTLDKGKTGVLNCINFWRTNYPEIAVLGINSTAEEQEEIYVWERDGIKIAFLNYTYGTNGIPLPSDMPYIVNLLDKEKMAKDIAKAKTMADFIVVLPHWGLEYTHVPDNQKDMAQFFLKNGVDLVIGAHSHVIQPVEMLVDDATGHQMLVYYSLGNFINSTADSGIGTADRMVGAMANVTLTNDESGNVYIKDYGVTPLVTQMLFGKGEITTYKLSDYTQELADKNGILARDSRFSLKWCKELCKQVFGDLYQP